MLSHSSIRARRWLRHTIIGGTAVLASACAPVQTTGSGAVGVDRKQYVSSLVTPSQVEQAAAQAYAETLSQARAEGALNRDAATVRRVQGISKRLIAEVPAFRPDAAQWQWQVNVIDSDEVNAWCMPGGRIAVYTGLIQKVKPTDDELAAVIGHEIAHALREHTREKMSQQMAANVGVSVLGMITGSQQAVDIGGSLSQVMFTLPNSRGFETEADAIGVELAARAGYDPRAAVSLWQKMAQAGGGSPPEILSTHPSPASRIAELQQMSQRVMPLYEARRR
ncbi:MAG: M48 family metallopeptidase [Pigmentiphaga sp.]